MTRPFIVQAPTSSALLAVTEELVRYPNQPITERGQYRYIDPISIPDRIKSLLLFIDRQ